MNCKNIQLLLPEFADERLDASAAWQVQTHVSHCEACGQVSRDFAAQRQALRTLPLQQPSARFDDMLAQRLALTRRPAAPVQTWRTKLVQLFSLQFASPAQRLRPALALGLVAAAGSIALFLPLHSLPQAVPVPVHSADPAFVADCVAQHHQDAAAEPLADMSAQTLAGRLDGAGSSDSSADTSLF